MDPLGKFTRREDIWTAEVVQYGVTLRKIIGLAEAQRYLLSRCVPQHVVERVLSLTVSPRRLLRTSTIAVE